MFFKSNLGRVYGKDGDRLQAAVAMMNGR